MKTLILGGIKSGKSRLAETLAIETGLSVTLIATASIADEEMRLRVQAHKDSRPEDWQTVEEPVYLGQALHELDSSDNCVVIDCITLWLTNLLLQDDPVSLQSQIERLLDAVDQFSGQLFIVSNETSMGIVPLGELTRRFCDEAGLLHQSLARYSDKVILTVAGLTHTLKSPTT
ncbi:MAG: bifunctional adenosylcobinamide kinase/adenosylcobinamide-phosphate guanylyltransferase [Granulosicoccus sp.]|nr:bifunctional adenosylcobinamide kinase/adenosylcobinamide-phosphate guanylyltransferase [Granulosicoccus sp.]